MKRNLFLVALAATALASCSQDEIMEVQQDAIKFNVVTENQTRAADIYCQNNLMSSFTLMATQYSVQNTRTDAAEYIGSKSMTVSNGTASFPTSEVFYWPQTGYLDFYAVANGTMTWSDKAKVPTITDFSLENEVSKQVDLLYAAATGQSKAINSEAGVNLNFRHALSQIVFAAKNLNPNIKVTITGVSVCNVYGQGTFTYPADFASTDGQVIDHDQNGMKDVTAGATESEQITIGTQGTWAYTNQTTTSDYTVTLETAVTLDGSKDEAFSLTSANDTDKEYNGNAMLLLPSSYTLWNPNASPYVQPGAETQTGTYFLLTCKIQNKANDSYV
ncbi:MAG: fimbrillin family protein [Bacteroides sp.]|nr:fimbrillin family protein [Bacteroides sp.]